MADILLNTDKDIQIENGDLVIGDSFQQEVGLIVQSNQGEWKNEPLVGSNLIELINSEASESEYKSKIKQALKLDNKELKSFIDGKIIVE